MNSKHKLKAGNFLISQPFMEDENFARSVLLLVEHRAEGSLGFVMSNPLESEIHELAAEMPYSNAPVFLGGPVEQHTLHFLHRLGDELPDSLEIVPGLSWGGDFEKLKEMISAGEVAKNEIVFFVGYSGWGAGQLEMEIKRGSWIVAPENPDTVFEESASSENLWQEVLRSMGERFRLISNYPIHPNMN